MKQRYTGVQLWGALLGCLLLCMCLVPTAWAQQTQGTVSVTVLDPTGAVVPGAQLKLTDLATNDVRTATTREAGNYNFINLNFGQYKLSISKEGFETQSYDVLVQAIRTTDVRATLKVGAAQTVVEVAGGAAPLVESSTNAINNTIDLKQIEDLPLGGRDIAQLSRLGAGYNGAFMGLPIMAQGNTVDGILGNTGRWKYGTTGTVGAAISPRLENIAEMTVSTDQLDMNSGWGTSSMQVTYVTRRGTNQYHGRIFEDHRNSALNAYSWGSNQKSKYHLNEFGASVGGPIFKDKLFFFANLSVFKQPGGNLVTRDFLTDNAKLGVFTYGVTSSNQTGYTANLFDVVGAYNALNSTTFPDSAAERNPVVVNRLAQVDQYMAGKGALYPQTNSDPSLATWMWQNEQPVTHYYPTFRIDYNISESKRLNFAFNRTKRTYLNTNAEHWPGDGRAASNKDDALTGSLGFEWTVSPTLINQFKFGYLYSAAWFGYDAPSDYRTQPTIWYNIGSYADNFELPNSRMQPVFSLSDNVSWAKGAHMFSFGVNAYRDQNKYWDPPEGYWQIYLGLNSQDPAYQALSKTNIQALTTGLPTGYVMNDTDWSRARQLYGTLAGRITRYYRRFAYDPGTGAFATDVAFSTLNELQKSWGLFFQDSYRMKRNLTVNYGLRWDFVSPDKDLTGKYHTLTESDLWGPTTMGALFQPGAATLTGTMNPQWVSKSEAYKGWKVTPQPAIGIAWTPRNDGSLIERLLGGDRTVLRAGYSLRRFTEPQQFIWDFGTNYATGFYQRFNTTAGSTSTAGTFVAGSLALGAPLPGETGGLPMSNFLITPTDYQASIPMSGATFGSLTVNSIKDGIRQPYTQSWNIGIQRELGSSRAIELRYNGNRTLHQWIAPNINEVNIFENGFLTEFNNAKTNLDVCLANQTLCKAAAGVTSGGTYSSFRNWSLNGQVDVPLMAAAAGTSSPNTFFTNSSFVNNLNNGQAGSFASSMANTKDYFCRLVGSTFGPCGTGYGTGALINGQVIPINFFVANPFAAPASAQILTDAGYSNYNSLQVEFRQRMWHGVTANANYTWSRTLGIGATSWYADMPQFTIRDLRSSYGPLNGDRNHVIHIASTYDLPFGKGKSFLNGNSVLDKVVGGWTVSTILTYQTGSAYRISGNNNTVNNMADGGITLNGITQKDILAHQGLFFVPQASGAPLVYFLDPDWVAQIKADKSIAAFNTPGEWGTMLYLHGPHQTYTDVGISKAVSFTERWKFKFQTEMTNAFNHPTFGQGTTGVASGNFGRGGTSGYSPRRIEFRANLEF